MNVVSTVPDLASVAAFFAALAGLALFLQKEKPSKDLEALLRGWEEKASVSKPMLSPTLIDSRGGLMSPEAEKILLSEAVMQDSTVQVTSLESIDGSRGPSSGDSKPESKRESAGGGSVFRPRETGKGSKLRKDSLNAYIPLSELRKRMIDGLSGSRLRYELALAVLHETSQGKNDLDKAGNFARMTFLRATGHLQRPSSVEATMAESSHPGAIRRGTKSDTTVETNKVDEQGTTLIERLETLDTKDQ